MDTQHDRWVKEADFFDAMEYPASIPSNTIERYTRCDRPYLAPERKFALMADVHGKRVLEIGCGGGGDAVILALKGATVVGVDISPKAIHAARRLSIRHGVQDRTDFQAVPLESYLPLVKGKEFDIICGFAILHHMLPVLRETFEQLLSAAHSKTTWVFTEPVTLSPALRKLRLRLPLALIGTPHERPLDNRDLLIMREYLPEMKMDLFGFALRLWARAFPGRYEDYSVPARFLYDELGKFDAALPAVPIFRALSSMAVIHSGPVQQGFT